MLYRSAVCFSLKNEVIERYARGQVNVKQKNNKLKRIVVLLFS